MFNTFYMSILLQKGATGYWNVMGLHMTLTIRSRSNLGSPMDSSGVVSYWCSIHFMCLTCSDKMLQADIAVFNVFLMGSYLTLIWPFRGHRDLPSFVHVWVCGCYTISIGKRFQKVITLDLCPCLILQFWNLFGLLWPWEMVQGQMVGMGQRLW